QVLDTAAGRRDLLTPIPGAPEYLRVEVAYAAAHEGALHLEDVLTRRTRIAIEYPHRGEACAAAVAELMGEVLGWDAAQRAREVEIYLARVAAERDSQCEPDDSTAAAARAGAPEARPRLLEPVS
ncbi:MAG: glycerol-3-phosphate dehydrogenase C-terminal domain-containing protein, partial [Pseudonocardiaceae bacterium]